MNTYLTEYKREGRRCCGDNIRAENWAAAEEIADRQGLVIVGELIEEFSIDVYEPCEIKQ